MSFNNFDNTVSRKYPSVIVRFGVAGAVIALTIAALPKDAAPLKAAPELPNTASSIRLAAPAFGAPNSATATTQLAIPTAGGNIPKSDRVIATEPTIEIRPRERNWSGEIQIQPRSDGGYRPRPTAVPPAAPRSRHSFISHPQDEATKTEAAANQPTEGLPGFALPEFMKEEDLLQAIDSPPAPNATAGDAKRGSVASDAVSPWQDLVPPPANDSIRDREVATPPVMNANPVAVTPFVPEEITAAPLPPDLLATPPGAPPMTAMDSAVPFAPLQDVPPLATSSTVAPLQEKAESSHAGVPAVPPSPDLGSPVPIEDTPAVPEIAIPGGLSTDVVVPSLPQSNRADLPKPNVSNSSQMQVPNPAPSTESFRQPNQNAGTVPYQQTPSEVLSPMAPDVFPDPVTSNGPPVAPDHGLTIPFDPNAVEQMPPVVEPAVIQPDATGPDGSPMEPIGPRFGHSFSSEPPPTIGHSFAENTFSGTYYPGMSGYRATHERDANAWLSPYQDRAAQSHSPNASIQGLAALPPEFRPWWESLVNAPSGHAASTLPVDLSMLLQDAMLYSPQVVAIKTEPEVQRLVIQQEAARFDWTAFLEATYDDLNDPVGNDLTTGNGQDRLLTRKLLGSGGVRQKNRLGGELRVAQDYGHENQNSRFFVPNNQATARLELSYRQPLWDGAGVVYNESEIVLAQIRANSSEDEVVAALQDHLVKVTEAYWALYSARAEYHQRKKLLNSAQTVLLKLEGRAQVDTIPRQILRARAAVARAQTRIQRTLARGKDAEAQLRLLVNSPGMLNGGPAELLPLETPSSVTENASLQEVLHTALINRPDISEAIRKMRAAGVRHGVSQKEILPRLDLLVETYVSDLAGRSDIGQAIRGQFLDNRPGYTVGLELEVPIGNRAALAKREQRRWELKRSINVFRATVEKSLTDVEIANREVATSYSEMLSRFQSMSAAENESRYLQDRFEVLPASEDSATLLLEDLLDSFERLADEETSFVQAQADHALALVVLKKELGVLLKSRHARPELGASDQEWVNERISSAVYQPETQNTNSNVVPSVSTQVKTASRTRTVTPPPQQPTQPVVAPQPSQNPVIHQPTDNMGRPTPRTPTTWKRPPVRGTSIGTF